MLPMIDSLRSPPSFDLHRQRSSSYLFLLRLYTDLLQASAVQTTLRGHVFRRLRRPLGARTASDTFISAMSVRPHDMSSMGEYIIPFGITYISKRADKSNQPTDPSVCSGFTFASSPEFGQIAPSFTPIAAYL